uniref:F-box protein AT5G49610-like beta-propeller domain-containing protein n=1 Tax=Aegilops tauschii TaxID=37682 RepID=N1QXK2_AEGTA
MASPTPPPAKKPSQLHPTTMTDLDDDTLREIFLRFPSLPSLVHAALSCRAFLDAVRSSPAFRRQFRALHPAPLLGLFLGIQDTVTPTFVPLLRRSDPDTAAAVRGADFFLTRLPVSEEDKEDAGPVPEDDKADAVSVPVPNREDDGVSVPVPVPQDEDADSVPVPVSEDDDDEDAVSVSEDDDDKEAVFEWSIGACRDGFVVLDNWSTRQVAVYNPLRRAMDLFPLPPHGDDCEGLHFDYHILAEEEDSRSSYRVVCVWHGERGARANVLSSDTKTWQVFPWANIDGLWPQRGKLVNGHIYWTVGMPTDARVLNTATMQFFRMDMPPSSRVNEMLTAGETKDGRLCVVFAPNVQLNSKSALVVWTWRADDDNGVERWMQDKSLPLQEILGIVRCDFRDDVKRIEVSVKAIIDGFVYLSAYCGRWQHHHSTRWLLSFSMETAELNNLGRIIHGASYPYIMPWPRSLVHSKIKTFTYIQFGEAENRP